MRRTVSSSSVVSWGSHLGWLHLDRSWLVFFANKVSLVVFSLFALGELVADKLSFIPARTQVGPLLVRIIFGSICAAALCLSSNVSLVPGAVLGGLGAVAGAFGGYHYRRTLGRASSLPDWVAALFEDVVAVGGGLLLVSQW